MAWAASFARPPAPRRPCRTRARRVGGVGPAAVPAPRGQACPAISGTGQRVWRAGRQRPPPHRDRFQDRVLARQLDRFGDTSVAEMLKRLPGVTLRQPWPGGEIRMRGMGGGYTQILVDGEPWAGGFDGFHPARTDRAHRDHARAHCRDGSPGHRRHDQHRPARRLPARNNDLRLGLNAEQEELSPACPGRAQRFPEPRAGLTAASSTPCRARRLTTATA